MKTYFPYLFAFLFLWACSSEEPIVKTPEPIEDTGEIRLSGKLGGVLSSSRGIGPITGTKPTSALSIDVFRADANAGTTATYGTTYTAKVSAATMTTAATGTNITWPAVDLQYYLADPARNTKLIGLYPSGGTYDSTNKKVTSAAQLDGATDVMCSALVQGCRKTPVTAMQFGHMLTRVNVYVKAQNATAASYWGNVTDITIAGKKVKYVVTLPAPTSGTASIAADASDTAGALTLTASNGGPTSSVTLSDTENKVFGYAMFLPVTTAAKLTFNIKTSGGGTAYQTTETTTAQTFAAGTAYNVNINFTVTGISITASITPWGTGSDVTANI